MKSEWNVNFFHVMQGCFVNTAIVKIVDFEFFKNCASTLGSRCNIFILIQYNIIVLHVPRKFPREAVYVFYVRCNKNDLKNVAYNTRKNKKFLFVFMLYATFLLHEINILSVAQWSHSMKKFSWRTTFISQS